MLFIKGALLCKELATGISSAASDNFKDIVKQLIKTNHSRVPVRNESLDDIVGILHIKDVLANLFLKEKPNIKSLLKKPFFVFYF